MLQQNQAESWWHWLYTNAPAAWISAIIAIMSLLLVLRTKRRPRKIVIRELSRSSLMRIWPSVRQKIKVTFGGDPIKTLGQIDVEIFNDGSEFIEQPELNFVLPEQTKILDYHTDPEEANAQCQVTTNRLSVRLPHLNPVREHSQIVSLSVLVDGPTAPLKITGGSAGWSIRHRSLPTAKRRSWNLIAEVATLLAFLPLMFLYYGWIEKRFGISQTEWSLRAFYSGLPPLAPLLAFIGFGMWKRIKKSKRSLTSWADE
jgi:hypothetical protein